ncbi:hypothetical protein QHF83_53410, partial [Polyangium sp. 15x6]
MPLAELGPLEQPDRPGPTRGPRPRRDRPARSSPSVATCGSAEPPEADRAELAAVAEQHARAPRRRLH